MKHLHQGTDLRRPGICGESANLFENTFAENLVRINGLDKIGFTFFMFMPGMLFDSSETWWDGAAKRSTRHEGLDLCFFETAGGGICRLDENIRVPAAFSGEIVHIMDDFLGKTIVAATFVEGDSSAAFFTLYAHVAFGRGIRVGKQIEAGQQLARIAPAASKKAPMPPHLHISFLRRGRLPDLGILSWPVLNKLERQAFLDPLPIIDCPFQMISGINQAEAGALKKTGAGND